MVAKFIFVFAKKMERKFNTSYFYFIITIYYQDFQKLFKTGIKM